MSELISKATTPDLSQFVDPALVDRLVADNTTHTISPADEVRALHGLPSGADVAARRLAWVERDAKRRQRDAEESLARWEAEKKAQAQAGAPRTLCSQCANMVSADTEFRPYVVKGLISRGNVVTTGGQPGAGKSALGPLVAWRVARGQPIWGRRVTQGTVLYVAAEDGVGMRDRVVALRRREGETDRFHLISEPIDLALDEDIQALVDVIARLRPALVVIDTLAAAWGSLKEDQEGMGLIRDIVRRRIIAVCNSAVMLLTHPAKSSVNPSDTRGSGVMNADADVTLGISGTRSEVRTVSLGKNRKSYAGNWVMG